MTDDTMDLQALLAKSPAADFLPEMTGFAALRLMELKVGSLTGAAYGEKSGDRLAQRNGYRERDWETRAGTVESRIPAQGGQLLPQVPRATPTSRESSDRRNADSLYPGRLDDLVNAMRMSGISKGQVSRLCEEIDVRVKAFLDRPIGGDWSYFWIDATYVKVRQAGRIVSVAVTIVVGVISDGRREVLGMAISGS